MTSHPILFNAEMVRALLDGRKSQTRRLVTVPWGKHSRTLPYEPYYVDDGGQLLVNLSILEDYDGGEGFVAASTVLPSPFGKVGDRLWVKETFHYDGNHAPDSYPCVHYAADRAVYETDGRSVCPERNHYPSEYQGPWSPSIHMPRWASRIALEVTGLRVEPVQAITEDDARAEGVRPFFEEYSVISRGQRLCTGELCSEAPHRASFAVLWDTLAREGTQWINNPWVWVCAFRRVVEK